MNSKEIKAIINLLDDPDEVVFSSVLGNLLIYGLDIIPELEKAWENTPDKLSQERIENLIQIIQFSDTKKNLLAWKNSETRDLLEGAFLVAKYQFSNLDFSTIRSQVEKFKTDVWLELNENLTALEKVKIFNHILFDLHKFSGNVSNYYSPQNSYINQVLETKKGNPISLAIIYSSVAQMLEIPIMGVNLPKNFILVYLDTHPIPSENNALFYINPFNKGSVLGKREIDYFIMQQNLSPEESFYLPCDNITIIQRLILNLIFSYEKLGYTNKIKDLQELYNILK